jgi:hypothetical protein
MAISIALTPVVNGIDITESTTTIESSTLALGAATSAGSLPFTPHGTITATNVQTALEQLADQDFRTSDTPTGTNVQEGDTWYDTTENEMKIYREISSGVFAWTNLVVTNTDDLLDAGAF